MIGRSVARLAPINERLLYADSALKSRFSTAPTSLLDVLSKVRDGTMSPLIASNIITNASGKSSESILDNFSNLDHERSRRTGFPEAIFAEGKTKEQVFRYMEDMAIVVNHALKNESDKAQTARPQAILATRATAEMYDYVCSQNSIHGSFTYSTLARIISMRAAAFDDFEAIDAHAGRSVVVATAGTTDVPVAEEAAVTLETIGIPVDRIYDVGVAGLHRVVRAIPRLNHTSVGCIIVCAGMDGALPSVVGGLVSVPVIAVPCSVGYGASFGGVSALLTMLNSCSPGVGVVNIDNGFGAAALAFKFVRALQ